MYLNQQTANLKKGLAEAEKKYKGRDDLFGMTALTNPGYISGSRSIMFTNHLKQFLNLLNPDYPLVNTNYENLVGENNTTIKKATRNWVVDDKIEKFSDGEFTNYMLILYDPDADSNEYGDIAQ